MSLSPDESRVLVTNASGGLIIYDIHSAHVVACVRDIYGLGEGSPAMFVHGGHAVLVGCEGGQAKLFDAASALCLQSLNHEGWCPVTPHDVSNLTLRRRQRLRANGEHIRSRGTSNGFSLAGSHSGQSGPVHGRNLCYKEHTTQNIHLGNC